MEVKSIVGIIPKSRNILISFVNYKYQYLDNFLVYENVKLHICYKWYSDLDSFLKNSISKYSDSVLGGKRLTGWPLTCIVFYQIRVYQSCLHEMLHVRFGIDCTQLLCVNVCTPRCRYGIGTTKECAYLLKWNACIVVSVRYSSRWNRVCRN